MEDHTLILSRIAEMVNPHVPKDICSTEDAVKWLIEKRKESQEALRDLEEIDTTRLCTKSLCHVATRISKARVKLYGKQ